MPKRQLQGIVISNKMLKTVVVEVERIKVHKKYKRRYKVHKNYKAHVENGEYIIGDKVILEETKPISKDKKWKVIEKISSAKSDVEEIIDEDAEILSSNLKKGDKENEKISLTEEVVSEKLKDKNE